MSPRDTAAVRALQAIAEFDHPFTVRPDGTVTDAPAGVYAPEVFHVDGASSPDDVDVMGAGWEPLTGYTGQHGYRGAVMHASEYLGGRLAADILETPGVYVVTSVKCLPEPAYPHRVDDTDGSCPECGAEDASAGSCPSHPDYPDTRGMSWGELADIDSETVEQEPAGWIVLRISGGPGNGDHGTECPAWDLTAGARCGQLMVPAEPRETRDNYGRACIGTVWRCTHCRYDVTVIPPDEGR